MTSGYGRIAILLGTLLIFAVPATAQVDNWAQLRCSTPDPYVIVITVELDIGGTLPEEWVGWVVRRRTIGACEDDVVLGSGYPFPTGAQTVNLSDPSAREGITYNYRIMAVDAQGGLHYLGSPPAFPPGYYHDDYGSLGGTGAVATGVLVESGWAAAGIILCPDECWEMISFVSELPPDLVPGVGSGVTVTLYGDIDNEFEGPYISSVSSWVIAQPCGIVPGTPTSWGGLKATYK